MCDIESEKKREKNWESWCVDNRTVLGEERESESERDKKRDGREREKAGKAEWERKSNTLYSVSRELYKIGRESEGDCARGRKKRKREGAMRELIAE